MTEDEYILVTNRVKVTNALAIMRDVLAGEKWGVKDFEWHAIIERLEILQTRLFSSYELEKPQSEERGLGD